MIEAATAKNSTTQGNPLRVTDGANEFASFQGTLQSMEEDFLRRFPQQLAPQQQGIKNNLLSMNMHAWARAALTPEPVHAPDAPSAANSTGAQDTPTLAPSLAPTELTPQNIKLSTPSANAWAVATIPHDAGDPETIDAAGTQSRLTRPKNDQRLTAQSNGPAGIHIYTVADGIAFSLRSGQDSSTAAMLAAWIRQRLQARGIYVVQSHVDGIARYYQPALQQQAHTGK